MTELKIKSRKELERKYPKSYLPLKLKVQSVYIPENRGTINDWFDNFDPHGEI